jgi:hypothetical protein
MLWRALGGGLAGLLGLTSPARAQAPDPGKPPAAPPAAVPGAAPSAVPAAPPLPPPAAAPAATPATPVAKAEAGAVEQRCAALEERIGAVEGTLSSAEKDESKGSFKMYGFADLGVQRAFFPEHSGVLAGAPSLNATNFVVSNVNLYLDAQPSKDWRFLGELRFTNDSTAVTAAPTPPPGSIFRLTLDSYGKLDQSAVEIPKVFPGIVSIERAHIDWTHYNYFKIRVGQFFTPFGIYNVDHASPVLITAYLPFFITSRMFPTRQIGAMVYGSAFAGPWELGYSAYVSNGRGELASFALNDDRGVGGRVFAANESSGDRTVKLGVSFYTGNVKDRVHDGVLDPKSSGGFDVNVHSTYAYREYIFGADASFDLGATRIRAEAAIARVVQDPTMQAPAFLGGFAPNSWTTSAYLMVAHRFKFLNMEPFVSGLFHRFPDWGWDTIVSGGGGLNFYVTPSVTIRTQGVYTWFGQAIGSGPAVPPNNIGDAVARLILAF